MFPGTLEWVLLVSQPWHEFVLEMTFPEWGGIRLPHLQMSVEEAK